MSRYNNYKKLNNSSKYYRFLREKRDKSKNLVQYETPILYHPSVLERGLLVTGITT